MDQVVVMHVLDCQNGLVPKPEGLGLVEFGVVVEVVEQVSMLGIFQNDVDLFLLLEDLVELDNVGVGQPAVDQYLSPEVFLIDRRDLASDIDLF